MIKQDVLTLISIFCDVDDFCKEFEAEWEKIQIEKTGQEVGDKKKQSETRIISK